MEVTRIVRLSFHLENVPKFMDIFDYSKDKIKAFEGNTHLEVYRDHDFENVMYTLSKWSSHESLENYRKSELFKSTWAKTKVLFNDKPMAFSLVV